MYRQSELLRRFVCREGQIKNDKTERKIRERQTDEEKEKRERMK